MIIEQERMPMHCPKAMDICKGVMPALTKAALNYMVACRLCGGWQV